MLNESKPTTALPMISISSRTENIGTGEGAQAYGHGLYFAEREGTAKAYRDNLKAIS